MDATFKALIAVREKTVEAVTELSADELNKIPKGFNNNILWNLGHVLVIQQLLTYRLSGLPLLIHEDLVKQFGKGSKPEGKYDQDTIEKVKRLLICTIKDLKQDYKSGIFKLYSKYTVSTFGVELQHIEDAITFVAAHDSVHFGYVLALKRAIAKKKSIF